MAKVIYINPLDDTTIDFKPTFKFSSGPITVIGENKKINGLKMHLMMKMFSLHQNLNFLEK